MRVFGFNISLGQRAEPSVVAKGAPEYPLSQLVANWPEDSSAGVLSNAYQQVVWVYRAVNALAEQVSNIPFRFSTLAGRGGENMITNGPLVEFYNQPHALMNRFQYWELRVIWLMLRGETFRIPIFDTIGRLKSVVLLDPSRFQHVVQDNQLIGWRYTDSSRNGALASQVFLPEEVWHEKLPNPFDAWRGMSPLGVAAAAASTDYAAGMFMKGVMENNGEAGTIIRTSEQLDPEQREQLLAALRARKRRAGSADRPVLLWAGAEVVTPKLASGDVQFLANRKFSVAEICAAFGVPMEIITSMEAAKYDVMAGARLSFIENRVVPLCRRLEAEDVKTVQAIDKNAQGWFDVEDHPVLAAARRDRLAAARAGFEMGVPFNELNRSFGLGLKAQPWGDKGYIPSSFVPADGSGRKEQAQ